MKTTLVILAGFLLVLGSVGFAIGAESSTAPVTATVTVNGVISVAITNTLDFGFVEPSAQPTDDLVLEVTSNDNYNIEVKADQANFNKDGSDDTTMAASDLEWDNGAGYTGYNETYEEVDTGVAGTDVAHTLGHKLNAPADAGLYELPITVKVATQ